MGKKGKFKLIDRIFVNFINLECHRKTPILTLILVYNYFSTEIVNHGVTTNVDCFI